MIPILDIITIKDVATRPLDYRDIFGVDALCQVVESRLGVKIIPVTC